MSPFLSLFVNPFVNPPHQPPYRPQGGLIGIYIYIYIYMYVIISTMISTLHVNRDCLGTAVGQFGDMFGTVMVQSGAVLTQCRNSFGRAWNSLELSYNIVVRYRTRQYCDNLRKQV